MKATWVEHEGHLHHRAGPRHSYLFFKYPLTGKFDFSFDAWNGGWAEGHGSFGGLTFETWPWNQTQRIFAFGEHGLKNGQVPFARRGETYNSWRFNVQDDGVRTYLNGHMVHHDKGNWSTSPWFALFARDAQVTDFRNFKITGSPVILRQVNLVGNSRLRGWVANFYGEQIHDQLDLDGKNSRPKNGAELSWRGVDDTIRGRLKGSKEDAPVQSRLYYGRPLSVGEAVSYEFFFNRGITEVHPTLDRVAFLFTPDGLRLHWMTTGSDEWTGLEDDNVVKLADSEASDGFPLKNKQWNQVRLQVARADDGNDVLRIFLNQKQVHEYPLDSDTPRHFGFFRYGNRTDARVRKVVLCGSRWPEKLTEEMLANLTEREPKKQTNPFSRARMRHAMITDKHFGKDAWTIWRTALDMKPENRFTYLKDWVIPNRNHATMRLTGDFTPATASPAAVDPTVAKFLGDDRGGQIVSPAMLMIDTAIKIGKLDELTTEIENFKVVRNLNNQRGRIALLGIIALKKGDITSAGKYFEELDPLMKKVPSNTLEAYRWPELLFGHIAAHAKFQPAKVQTMLRHIDVVQKPRVSPIWKKHLDQLRGLCIHATLKDLDGKKYTEPINLGFWKPVAHVDAKTLAEGTPGVHWSAHNGQLRHYPGSQHDSLYYQIPIRGNFEVSAELSGWREIQIGYAGTIVSVGWGRGDYHVSHLGRIQTSQKFDPPLKGVDYSYKYRLVVKDGVYQAFVNDRKIHETKLSKNPDPWLVLYQPSGFHGFAKNLELKGDFIVPEEVTLSGDLALTGWHNDFYASTNTNKKKIEWKFDNGEIQANRHDLKGSGRQSILQYHRPLFEDGQIEYEFYFDPKTHNVHPTLGRLTFLMEEDGVKLHWLTNGMYERSNLAANNSFDEPENRLGPQKFPLKPKEWNKLKLTLKGNSVIVSLNGQDVFKRELDTHNNRVFGLFHFADDTAVRVRNVKLRGEWPKQVTTPNLITETAQ